MTEPSNVAVATTKNWITGKALLQILRATDRFPSNIDWERIDKRTEELIPIKSIFDGRDVLLWKIKEGDQTVFKKEMDPGDEIWITFDWRGQTNYVWHFKDQKSLYPIPKKSKVPSDK